jgi:DHA3 family macrolide efflux protein-like MFS transporter
MLAGFSLVWWVTETTGSATALATAALVQVLPGVLLGPFVGALVDRWNRRLVMIVADGAIALFSAWLAYLFWVDALQLWHVYLITAVRAIGGTFHWPAMTASTSLMVPEERLPRIAGINQTMGGIMNVVSPPLGALALALMPLHSIMAIDVASAAFAIAPLFFVSIPQPAQRTSPQTGDGSKPSLLGDVREGLRYVGSWPGLLAVCLMATLLNFLVTPAMSLLPLLVTDHFRGEALQLGWMNSAWGVGLVVGGLTLSAWGGFRRRIVTMLVGIIGLGAGLLGVGLAPATALPLALAGMFAGAAMNSLCNGSAHALLQKVVAPEMQGRVFTVVISLCNAVTPLSIAIAGPLADKVGVRPLYLVGGVSQILIGVGAFFVPAIMGLEDRREERESALDAPMPSPAMAAGVGAE